LTIEAQVSPGLGRQPWRRGEQRRLERRALEHVSLP